MSAPPGTIVAMGGGGFSMEPDNPLLDRWLLGLTGAARPRVCFVPTASGDSDAYIERFYAALSDEAECTHLPLFRRSAAPLEEIVFAQDVIYVGGGNTANMLAIWREHGLDRVLERAWRRGVILAGLSAGAICWFDAGPTDSYGGELAPWRGGLGLLAGSFCPHYDGEEQRRPSYMRFVGEGALPDGVAVDDGVALRYEGRALAEVVSSRRGAGAYRVSIGEGESAKNADIAASFLGERR